MFYFLEHSYRNYTSFQNDPSALSLRCRAQVFPEYPHVRAQNPHSLLFPHRHHRRLAKAVAEGATAEGAEVRLRRAREFVSPDVMAQAPGWKEQAEAMNARYEAPTPKTRNGPMPSSSARPPASARCRRN
jgi:hypothetical protein